MKKEQNILVFKNLKEVSAVLFHEIKYSANILLLDKYYDDEKKYSDLDIIQIEKCWANIYDEYFDKSDNSKSKKNLSKNNKSLKLLFQIQIIRNVIGNIELLESNKELYDFNVPLYIDSIKSLCDDLNKLHSNINVVAIEPLQEQLKQVNSVLGGLETRYKTSFKEEHGFNDDLDILQFYKDKASMEGILERSLDEKVNMMQWIAYEQQCNVIIASRKK